jgi:acetyltransferase-like isoleucine patch superfamily enzyme
MLERDVTIGADCWIGTKAVITAGVSLGDGCVIGAGAVVTHDIPAGAIAAGVPARVIRMRD